ncbi:hypothetical protein FZEAL_10052 [Fusarium zealandicum]|uniref:Methyltransferase n=1 Tax=Fusarium zealandicum TaxID=1053134 RepID=A0A8H4U6C1_9HYPO|nr:hypothetical protein FZEAL_10052 [Fusarium zealandicum]
MSETMDPNRQAPTAAESSESSPPATSVILPPQHWAQIAETEDVGGTDNDSSIEPDNASSTASISSSILEYRTIHGRTYHSEQGNAQYWGSNDETQNELMDLTDFADHYPGAEVVGTDLSPIQPSWVPPNVKFEIEDCTQEWTFRPDSTDYIHMRWLMGSIKDWNALFSESFRVCKPGGWIESHEASPNISSDDNTIDPNSAMGHWGKFFIEGSKKIGSNFTAAEDGTQKRAMEEAGFINIQEFDFRNPIGPWSKDPVEKQMGAFTKYGLETDSEGFILFMAHTLGWKRDEIMVYIAHFRREIRQPKYHGYFAQKVVWGQKPEHAAI